MTSIDEAVQTAIDTLAEICAMTSEESTRDDTYGRRSAAEEILRHHRETVLTDRLTKGITVTINGSVPVRPMVRSELGTDAQE